MYSKETKDIPYTGDPPTPPMSLNGADSGPKKLQWKNETSSSEEAAASMMDETKTEPFLSHICSINGETNILIFFQILYPEG